LRYEFRPDLTWTATWESRVPAGIFAQGSARRLEGVYVLRGRRLELRCRAVLERDPMSLGFVPVRSFDGDGELLLRGIRGKILPLPEDTAVWPGHGPSTTIAREKATNPFLRS
jgi:hypothetical protein